MKIFMIFVLSITLDTSFSQYRNIKPSNSNDSNKTYSVHTDIFWLDLCKPTGPFAMTRTKGRSRLEVRWNNALSFGLTNTNHFKYDYKINSIPFASFVDTSYSNFANSVKSAINLTPDPFFVFEVQSKSPNKERYQKLSLKLDTLNNNSKNLDSKLLEIENKFFDGKNWKEEYLDSKNLNTRNEYSRINKQYDSVNIRLHTTQNALNEIISFKNQKTALSQIVDKLLMVNVGFLNNSVGSNIVSALEANIDSLPDSMYSSGVNKEDRKNKDYNINDDLKGMSALLDLYQQSAQIVRTYLGRFEIKYDSIKNDFLSSGCKSLDPEMKEKIKTLVENFLITKEVFYDLQSLYTSHPLENEYLEKYLSVENQYADFLFIRFMSLQKVINVNTIYVTPTSSNMKNYDLISLELEKTNKLSNHTEKYNYDIYIKGGLKVDFSAGIFGSFLTNHQYNAVDSLSKDFEPTNMKMIKQVNNGKMNIAFGGMVNITNRTGASWFAPGISFGLILSTQPSFQFTSGLTLAIGKTERLLLHGGYALGFVKRIDGLPVNENIPSIRIGDAVRTVDKFLAKPFFGLTYNLSKNNVFKVSSFNTSTGSSSSGPAQTPSQ